MSCADELWGDYILIVHDYKPTGGRRKRALLINPPIYDTRYWNRWSQPAGLLRIARLLVNKGYKTEFIDCLGPQKDGRIKRRPVGKIHVGDIEMTTYHYGIELGELERRLKGLEISPTHVYVTSGMTYWWKSTRDVISLVKRIFPKSEVLVGGIYPTLCPEHAEANTKADVIVSGEVREASDLWTDLSLYRETPKYAIIGTSRGCPYNCAHCAQRKLNGPSVRHRNPEDVVEEIIYKAKRYGIRRFAFYEDNILIDCEEHFERILDLLLEKGLRFHFTAPEGFEVRLLYPRLLRKMRAAGFRSLYLPLEMASLDGNISVDEKRITLDEFETAVEYCREAGYKPGVRQEVNAFILYGAPHQPLEILVDMILYATHIVGNVTPMLYTPVPGSKLYDKYLWYFKEKGLKLEDLNGKLFPFWQLNNMLPSDYIDLQRLMYAFHTQFRGRPFDPYGTSLIARLVRKSLLEWETKTVNRACNE